MTNELQEFIAQNEKEQKMSLTIQHIGFKIYCFGKNGISLENYDRYELTAKTRIYGHIFILVGIAFWTVFKWSKVWPAFVIYIAAHWIIKTIGEQICGICEPKLNKIQIDCQKKLDEFTKMNYQQMGIWRLADHDEVRMKEHNLIISENTFTGDFHSNIAPIHICCLKNSTQELWNAEDLENNFIDMKKNIASSEFNQKFQIFVPKDRERDSMKMLSPTTQIVLVKSSAFERISAVHIYSDHICGVMEPQLVRPERCVDAYKYQLLRGLFSEVEEYCQNMRKTAEEVWKMYEQFTDVMN